MINEKEKKFVHKVASSVCKRDMQWGIDEELTISEDAFENALKNYKSNMGSFWNYARNLIKSSLYDYIIKNNEHFSIDLNQNTKVKDYIEYRVLLSSEEVALESNIRANEVFSLSNEIHEYGIDFDKLSKKKIHSEKTEKKLLNLVFQCLKDENIIQSLKEDKKLPIDKVKKLGICRKGCIKKYKNYIITMILLFSSDYIYLKSYLNIQVGEGNGQNRSDSKEK